MHVDIIVTIIFSSLLFIHHGILPSAFLLLSPNAPRGIFIPCLCVSYCILCRGVYPLVLSCLPVMWCLFLRVLSYPVSTFVWCILLSYLVCLSWVVSSCPILSVCLLLYTLVLSCLPVVWCAVSSCNVCLSVCCYILWFYPVFYYIF